MKGDQSDDPFQQQKAPHQKDGEYQGQDIEVFVDKLPDGFSELE